MRSAGDFFEHRLGDGRQAVQVHPPLITSSDCEGAGEVFTISPRSEKALPTTNGGAYGNGAEKEKQKLFFREPKYLTVSSQLHLEAWAAELGDVWALSPTFRAEESDTSRHLAEFYMLEGEFRQATSVEQIAQLAENLIRHLTTTLHSHRTGKELLDLYADRRHRPADQDSPDLEQRWKRLLPTQPSYLTVTYTDAISELSSAYSANASTFEISPSWASGFSLEHERWIVQHIGKGLPTIVTHYPKAQKPFYMLPSSASSVPPAASGNGEGETVACFDILLPFGYAEVCGGSLREHRLPNLIDSMREKGLLKTDAEGKSDYPGLREGESLGSLEWYADLRRFGSSPHGGFGLGFDRLLAYLTGASSVRDVVGFPRWWGRADC